MTTYTQLKQSERYRIEAALKQGLSLKSIARQLGRSPSTISREIQRNLTVRMVGSFNHPFNPCSHRRDCAHKHLCSDNACRRDHCRDCRLCISLCPDFERQLCTKLLRSPYVCNACSSRRSCSLEKFDYLAKQAQLTAQKALSDARSGFLLSPSEFDQLNSLISPLIRQGQSLYHICQSHKDSIMRDVSTLYRYVNAGLFDAKRMDLPQAIRYRSRRKKRPVKVERNCRSGRSYQDFLSFLDLHPHLPVVEMDSVEGVRGGKVLLTLFFRQSMLLLAFLRPANDAHSVSQIFDSLYGRLGPHRFAALFPLILTDNGSEFSNPSALEFDRDGNRRTRIFYCDPRSSFQKGALENAHRLLRKVLPKGTSFDSLDQKACDLIVDHVNSYIRKKQKGKSAYDTFRFLHGDDTLSRLGCTIIPAEEVHLRPNLLTL